MSRNGLTFTVIFLAESANYGEGVGNISTLKKMTINSNDDIKDNTMTGVINL